ncbi:alpha-ribazole phosphatase family protein [Oceaniserpentilla sp. 4NH20-0058]|uniref:histidine phosphatase family protein n=1 Tax=Oceaniserpentilla sp. 4NH20-0058 TaxID=3127660 RepID=UPI003104FE87
MTTQRKTIDLLRHGEPHGGNVFRGRTDHPLTELGWEQMENAVANKTWDVIISSPLSRCWQFAQSLAKRLDIELLEAGGLREFDFGIWENQLTEDVYSNDFERIKGLWEDPMHFASPEGESVLNFEGRILKDWFGCLARPEQSLLVICHGGVIRMLLKEILGLPYPNINRFDVPYASLTRISVNEAEPFYYQLVSHRGTSE